MASRAQRRSEVRGAEKRGIRRWYGKEPWECVVSKRDSGTTSVSTKAGSFVIKQSRHGWGCFTGQEMEAHVLLGVYPGLISNERAVGLKLGQLPFERQSAVMKYLVQSRLHSTEKSKCYIDPTNSQGTLDQTFSDNPMLYINEPDADQSVNVQHVWNYDTDRLELWSSRKLKEGEELLVCYGASYTRQYTTIQRNAQTCIFKDGELQWVDE